MWDVNFRGISIKKWFYIFISFYWWSIKKCTTKRFSMVRFRDSCLPVFDLEWFSTRLYLVLACSSIVLLGLPWSVSDHHRVVYKVD